MKNKASKKFSLNYTDYKKIAKDAVIFLSVPILFFLFQIHTTATAAGHTASVNDFIPNASTIVAIEVWAVSQAINTIKKYIA